MQTRTPNTRSVVLSAGQRGRRASARFADRRDAGRELGAILADHRREAPVVEGIVPDGMPVAAEVARALDAPLEASLIAEVRAGDRMLGMVAEGGITVIDEQAAGRLAGATPDLRAAVARARRDLQERVGRCYPAGRRLAVTGRTVLLVDDWLADSRRALPAARSLRARGARRLILAVPVAAEGAVVELGEWVDDIVYVDSQADLGTLGRWYADAGPTSEEEVAALLSEHAGAVEREAIIDAGSGVRLFGELSVPWGAYARGVIVLAYGPGETRLEPRHRAMAAPLNRAGFATLSVDLLAPGEQLGASEAGAENLAARLIGVTHWVRRQPETARLAVGYLADRAAAPAALQAARRLRAGVGAVLACVAGPPELAQARRHDLLVPVRLIAGPDPRDPAHIGRLAADWFTRHLSEAVLARRPGREMAVQASV